MGKITWIAGDSIVETARGDVFINANNVTHNAGQQVKTTAKKTNYGEPEKRNTESQKNKQSSQSYQLPMLVGYSLGFDNNNTFPNLLNDAVKDKALSQDDSTFGVNGHVPDGYDKMDGVSETDLRKNMLQLLWNRSTAKNGMRQVVDEMFMRFLSNEGGTYENSIMEGVIDNDEHFKSFAKGAIYKLLIKLKLINYDLNKLKPNDLVRFYNIAFNRSENDDDGLLTTIDAVEHVEMYLTDYIFNEKTGGIYMAVKFILYDTFGLDMEDLETYGNRSSFSFSKWVSHPKNSAIASSSNGVGITSWWLLQHKYGHKPFITKNEITVQGHYNKNTIYSKPTDPKKNTSNDTNYNR